MKFPKRFIIAIEQFVIIRMLKTLCHIYINWLINQFLHISCLPRLSQNLANLVLCRAIRGPSFPSSWLVRFWADPLRMTPTGVLPLNPFPTNPGLFLNLLTPYCGAFANSLSFGALTV
jgi:hypothetical protein